MNSEVPVRLVLVDPPAGVDLGIQRGRGSQYEPILVQQRERGDLSFDFCLAVSGSGKNRQPNFRGPFVQGPSSNRFIYIDVGTYAGQKNTPWSRRMKVPLQGITWPHIHAVTKPGHRLVVRIPGTGKDGGPNCGTVELLADWRVIRSEPVILR